MGVVPQSSGESVLTRSQCRAEATLASSSCCLYLYINSSTSRLTDTVNSVTSRFMLPEVNSIYSAMLRMGLLVIVASCLLAHGVASPSDINGEINSVNDGANPVPPPSGFATRVADEDAQHLLQIAS